MFDLSTSILYAYLITDQILKCKSAFYLTSIHSVKSVSVQLCKYKYMLILFVVLHLFDSPKAMFATILPANLL